jgi:hypothetical protein
MMLTEPREPQIRVVSEVRFYRRNRAVRADFMELPCSAIRQILAGLSGMGLR